MILIRPLPCRCGGRVHPIIDRHWRRRRGWWFTIALRLALVAVIVLVLLGVVVALVGRRAALLRRKRMGVFPVELQHFDQEGAVLAQAADGERAAASKGPTCRPDGAIVRLLVLVPPFLVDFALRRKPFSRLRFGQRVDPDPLVPITILSTTAQVALLIARARRVVKKRPPLPPLPPALPHLSLTLPPLPPLPPLAAGGAFFAAAVFLASLAFSAACCLSCSLSCATIKSQQKPNACGREGRGGSPQIHAAVP